MARMLAPISPEYDGEPALDYRFPPAWFHVGQVAAWNSTALDVVVVAGSQGGKTAEEAHWLLREIQRCAPLIKRDRAGRFIYAGPTLTLMGEQAIPAFKALFEQELQLGRLVQGNKPKFYFSREGLQKVLGFTDCPVTVTFAYANDSSNLESVTAQAGVWDEAGQKENKEESYYAFTRRLTIARSTTFGLPSQDGGKTCLEIAEQCCPWWIERFYDLEGPGATFGRRFWGTTPYVWNWFKQKIYDKAQAAKAIGQKTEWDFFNFPTWMNPRQDRAVIEAEMALMPIWKAKMMYEGLYTKPAGLVFDCFDEQNKVDEFPIPANWRRFHIGSDFGGINTAGVGFAEDPDTDDLFQFWEYWPQVSRTFEEHGSAMKALAGCTPSGAGGSRQEQGWREAFRQQGISLDEPPNNDVAAQYGCLYAQIKSKKLKIFKTCSKTIEMYENFSYVLDDSLQPTDAYDHEERYHLLAASRYEMAKIRPTKLGNIYTSKPATGNLTINVETPVAPRQEEAGLIVPQNMPARYRTRHGLT